MLVPNINNTKTVSDLRENPVGLLEDVARLGGPRYIFHRSTPKAVLLSISEYEQLLEKVESIQKLKRSGKN